MLDRDTLIIVTAAGLTLSFLAAIGAVAQSPGPPFAAAQGGRLPIFLDQRRLPSSGPGQRGDAASRLEAESQRKKAEDDRRAAEAEAEASRRLAIQAELEKARRMAAEAEARLRAEEARRLAAEQEARRLAAEAEVRRKAEDARRAEAQRLAAEAQRLAAEAEARRKKAEAARSAAGVARARQDAAKSKTEIQRLRAEAELKRRATAQERRLQQQRAIAAEAEPKISPQAARALAAKAAAQRKAEEQRLISARAGRAAARRLANEARKSKQAKASAAKAAAASAGPDTVLQSNPALSRYSVGIEDEFDAMEAGLEDEYDALPEVAPAAVARTVPTTVGAAITSSAIAAPLVPSLKEPPGATVQNCQLVSERIEQGVLKLRLKTSASTKGAISARVGGIVHQARLAPNGDVMLSAPVLSSANAVEWTFPGNSRCATALRPAGSPSLLQVALIWQGTADLNMHVLEPGAWQGGLYGHIWSKRPNSSLQAGAGRLSLFGAPGSATRMQVYSVDPRQIGRRRILNVLVDFASRASPPFCSGAGGSGRSVKYEVHIFRPAGGLAPAGPEVRSFQFAPKPCGTLIPARQRYEKLSLRP